MTDTERVKELRWALRKAIRVVERLRDHHEVGVCAAIGEAQQGLTKAVVALEVIEKGMQREFVLRA